MASLALRWISLKLLLERSIPDSLEEHMLSMDQTCKQVRLDMAVFGGGDGNFFGHALSMWKFPHQGLIPHLCRDPSCYSDNARSLTCAPQGNSKKEHYCVSVDVKFKFQFCYLRSWFMKVVALAVFLPWCWGREENYLMELLQFSYSWCDTAFFKSTAKSTCTMLVWQWGVHDKMYGL